MNHAYSFRDVLQQKLKETGHSVSWLANSINVPRPTLQTWLIRGRYPAKQLERILENAGIELTREQVERDMGVATTLWTKRTPLSADVRSVERTPGLKRARDATREDVQYDDLLSSLLANDMLVSVVTDGLPPEVGEALVTMHSPQRQTAIRAALTRGAELRYVLPSTDQVAKWAQIDETIRAGQLTRVEDTIRWWVAESPILSGLREQVGVSTLPSAPIFALGQHSIFRLRKDNGKWHSNEGKIFAETARSGLVCLDAPLGLLRFIASLLNSIRDT